VGCGGFTRLVAFILLVPAVYIAAAQGLLCLVPTVVMLLLLLALALEVKARYGIDFSQRAAHRI
jgi:hypothetical protein